MKKYCILSFFIALSFFVYSQKNEFKEPNLPIDSSTKTITYSKIISINASKDSLFSKGKSWFYSYFKNPVGVIRQEDLQKGIILGKHQIKVLNPPDKNKIQTIRGIVQYTINTQYKDNKVRIIVNEINLRETSYMPIERWLDKKAPEFTEKNYYYLEQIDKEINALIKNFEEYMTKPLSTKKEDW
jgi:hypothetical protein